MPLTQFVNTPPALQGRRARPVGLFATLLLAAALVPGCLYDSENRCSENQEYRDEACYCVETAALVDDVCVLCGDNEVPTDDGCVCEAGFARNSDGDCEQDIDGLGDPCSTDEDCAAEGATVCYLKGEAEDGVCTVPGCDSAADCPLDYACDVEASPTLCLPPPTGYGESCSSSDDCSEFEASYCESLQSNLCLVQCADDPGVCRGDFVCCDYRGLGGTALCVTPTELVDGNCPAGGDLLEAN